MANQSIQPFLIKAKMCVVVEKNIASVINSAEQSMHPTRESLAQKSYHPNQKVLRSPRAGKANR